MVKLIMLEYTHAISHCKCKQNTCIALTILLGFCCLQIQIVVLVFFKNKVNRYNRLSSKVTSRVLLSTLTHPHDLLP